MWKYKINAEVEAERWLVIVLKKSSFGLESVVSTRWKRKSSNYRIRFRLIILFLVIVTHDLHCCAV